jgi:hypothetical protein
MEDLFAVVAAAMVIAIQNPTISYQMITFGFWLARWLRLNR